MANSPQHFNGDIYAAIDVETTGLDPIMHEIWQIAIVPLDSFLEPRKDIPPFSMFFEVTGIDSIDWDHVPWTKDAFVQGQKVAICREAAVAVFEKWYDMLQLPYTPIGTRKRIRPVGHNYDFDKAFIMQWLGENTYAYYFHHDYRDVMRAAAFINDWMSFKAKPILYPKSSVGSVGSVHNIKSMKPHDAMQDALATAATYRAMCNINL